MSDLQSKQTDIPLPAAVILLGVVIAALVIGPNATHWEQLGSEIDAFVDRYPWFVGLSVGAIFLNAFATHLFAQKWVSYRRQGRRLRELTGEGKRDYRRLWTATLIVSSATSGYAAVLSVLRIRYGIDFQRTPETLLYLMTINLSLAAAIMSHWTWRMYVGIRVRQRAGAPLVEPAAVPNRLILGTTYLEVANGDGA